jgi:hypothetical protein
MRDEETFHELKYKRKVRIVFANSKLEWKLFLPHLSYGVGGATLQTGDTIFINYEKIASQNRNLSLFFNHELSHELLYQNSGFLKAYRMYKHFWIEEGLATYYGGPWDYYSSKEEYLATFRGASLNISDNPLLLYENLREQGAKLSYTTYRYFFEYLSDFYGQKSLKKFISLYTKTPKDFESDFQSAFGVNIPSALRAFDEYTFGKGDVDPAIMQSITDFDSCALLYPVMESYPERCLTPDGRSFTKQY